MYFGKSPTAEPWASWRLSAPKAPKAHGSAAGLFLALLMTTGCGYQQSGVYEHEQPGYQWHSLYREDIQTVAVPVFVNRSFQRGLEVELTKSVIHQMETHTPYKVVSPDRADTILEGEIVEARTATYSTDAFTALPQEQSMVLVVNFTWKNLRTGQILVERRGFDQRAAYFPTLGEGVTVGQEQATDRLGLDIVQELQADW
ncbi:MAG TPA: LptE family protein [Tepidisphaeraceae bacterium]|nr:LptE family protein [Tepidisphaeraceae bacterium]